MIVFLLLGVGTGSAQANSIKPEHFFDFDYAVSLWTTKTTAETFRPLYDCHTHNDGAFIAWGKVHQRTPQQAIEELEGHPHAEAIRRCYDTRLTFEKWREVYRVWRAPLWSSGGEWNNNPSNLGCLAMRTINIFTHSCNDLPDWRTPVNAAEDAKWIAGHKVRKIEGLEARIERLEKRLKKPFLSSLIRSADQIKQEALDRLAAMKTELEELTGVPQADLQ